MIVPHPLDMSIPLTLKARNKLVADDILNLIMFFFFFFFFFFGGGGGGGGGGVREDDNPCESSVRLMECQTLFSLKKKIEVSSAVINALS